MHDQGINCEFLEIFTASYLPIEVNSTSYSHLSDSLSLYIYVCVCVCDYICARVLSIYVCVIIYVNFGHYIYMCVCVYICFKGMFYR